MTWINIEQILAKVEARWKHVAYDPKNNRLVLLTDPYRCVDTRADYFDCTDGRREKRVLNNPRRVLVSKTKDWVYLGKK